MRLNELVDRSGLTAKEPGDFGENRPARQQWGPESREGFNASLMEAVVDCQ